MNASYIKMLGPIAVLAVALIQLALQNKWRKWHDARTKVHKSVLASLVCLMIIGTVITCVIVWEDQRNSSLLADKVAELLTANTNLEKEVQLKSEQLVRLAEANAALTQDVSKSITGGDTFCYFMHSFPVRTTNTIFRVLIPVGRYPLHNIEIKIVDGNKSKEVAEKFRPPLPISELKKAETIIRKPILFKAEVGDSLNDGYVDLPPEKDYQSYSIFFSARNGAWHQQVSLRRVEGKWKLASRVRMAGTMTLLMPEMVSQDFPKDKNGNIMW
jgi:hypothetical protein